MIEYDFILEHLTRAGDMLLLAREDGFVKSIKGGNPRDIITSTDLAVNTFLIEAIQGQFPNDSIYSEEGGGGLGEAGRVWTIDPIDGTSHFSRGVPHFAVCLGYMDAGMPIAGGVYNPVTRELFSFEKGKGAFLNGKPIHVSPTERLSDAFVCMRAGRKPELWDWGSALYGKLLEKANKTYNLGSSSLDICFVAAGRIEGAIYGTLSTMDIAPAIGILTEAGGVSTDERGMPAPLSSKSQKIIAANNVEIARALVALI